MHTAPTDDKTLFIETLCGEIRYKPIREVIADEYRTHIDELTQDLIESGHDPQSASQEAITRMGDPAAIGRQLDRTHRPRMEWSVLLLTAALTLTGILARIQFRNDIVNQPMLISTVIGITALFGLRMFNYKKLAKCDLPLWAVAIAGLFFLINNFYQAYSVSAFLGYATVRRLTGLMVPLLIISYGSTLSRRLRSPLPAMMAYSIPLVMISLLQISEAAMLFVVILSMTYIANRNNPIPSLKRLSLPGLLLTGPTGLLLLCRGLNYSYYWNRINGFLHPEQYADSYGYMTLMIRMFLSSSQPFGTAVVQMGDNQHVVVTDFLPDVHYNFILTGIIATFGWILAVGVLALLLVFLWRVTASARQSVDLFGQLISAGIGIYFMFQIIYGILMCLGLMPVAAVYLPFLAYDKIGYVTNMVMIGLLLSVYRLRDITISPSSHPTANWLLRVSHWIFTP